jgi:hypothetical protein
MKKIFSSLASSALLLTLGLADTQGAHTLHGGHDRAHLLQERARHGQASRVRRRASKARRRSRRALVSYACPMHPDMRSHARGECPKCGMALVAARRVAKVAGGGETESAGEGHSNP